MGFETKEDNSSVTAILTDNAGAKKAIKELKNCGLEMKKLSVVWKDNQAENYVVGFHTRAEPMRCQDKRDLIGGECWGDLVNVAFLTIPEVGPIIVAGPVAGWIISALEGSIFIGGMSALGAGLVTLGIPRRAVFKYEIAIKAGKFVLITLGTDEDSKRVRRVLEKTTAEDIYTHEMPPEPARVA